MIMFRTKPFERICKSTSSKKPFLLNGFKKANLFSIQVEDSLLEGQLGMPDLLEEKLSLTHMEVGEDMEEEPSLERMPQRLTDLLLMRPDGLLKT